MSGVEQRRVIAEGAAYAILLDSEAGRYLTEYIDDQSARLKGQLVTVDLKDVAAAARLQGQVQALDILKAHMQDRIRRSRTYREQD